MSLTNWYRSVRERVRGLRRRPRRRESHQPPRAALQLEALEDRAVPTVVADPLPTDWAPTGSGHTNLYTGLNWIDVTQLTGGIFTYNYAVSDAANRVLDGFDDWRLPTKIEAQAAAISGYGAAFGWPPPGAPYWTSTAVNGRAQWEVYMNDPAGSATTNLKNGVTYATNVRDPGVVLDDGDGSCSDTGWKKGGSGAYGGDQHTMAAGDGLETATWTFTGLEAGATYRVAVTWKAASGNATNASFTIFDGAIADATKTVNQRIAPNEFAIEDRYWEDLGTYQVTGMTLSVHLSNLANGTVVADAIRIVKVYEPPLMAASPPASGQETPTTIQAADLTPIVAEAIARWEAVGLTPAQLDLLASLQFQVADLGGTTLSFSVGHMIWVDVDAAGWGWFVDPTPGDDSEFTTAGDQGELEHMICSPPWSTKWAKC